MKSYQLIEPDVVYNLSLPNAPFAFYTGQLLWIVAALNADPELRAMPVEIEVIVAEYTGKYPCIGVHYLQENPENIEPWLVKKIESLYEGQTVAQLRDFIIQHRAEIEAILSKCGLTDQF